MDKELKPYKTVEELEKDIKNSVTRDILITGCKRSGIMNQNHKYYWRWIYVEVKYLMEIFPDIVDRLKEEKERLILVDLDKIYPYQLQRMYGLDTDKWEDDVRKRIREINDEIYELIEKRTQE